MSFDTPVLLLAWRRPQTLRRVIEAIRPVAPARMFVACDGPRSQQAGEAELVEATRAVIAHEIDWPCTIDYLYSETHQGLRRHCSRAADWFFGRVDEGIILEDDTMPHPDFFVYCATLLEKYRHDQRVWCISGDNATSIKLSAEDSSYGFVKYALPWGWATWKRCWDRYLRDYDGLEEIASNPSYMKALFDGSEALSRYRLSMWRGVRDGTSKLDSWLAAWSYTCMLNSGLTIIPAVNLISNIGYGEGGTNLTGPGGVCDSAQAFSILPLSHPRWMIRDRYAEEAIVKDRYGLCASEGPRDRVRRKLKSLWLRLVER